MVDSSRIHYRRTLFAMVFFSGFAGLVYQVLWMRQLGLLFGNTAQATSVTLSAFFAGLAVGSGFWGRRAGRVKNPLRVYALLEAGMAGTALLYFIILHLFYEIYPYVYQSVSRGGLMLLVKFALALLLIFPPAFCMGGTLPVMAQHLIRNRALFGRTSALLYGINTLGAAAGAASAVFVLVLSLGFRLTCVAAILISAAVAGVAWRQSARSGRAARGPEQPDEKQRAETEAGGPWSCGRRPAAVICFLSGFGVLALEVLWTRLFAQVHSNSVYAFTVILVVVLTGLALGAFISAWLARLRLPPRLTLAFLALTGGAALVLGPALFMHVTDGLQPFSSMDPWRRYVPMLFYKGFAAIGIVVVALGVIFPFIMKTEEAYAVSPGRTLGRLLAINTAGSILGALLCGFVLLPLFGMWRTMQLVAALYLVAGFLLPSGWGRAGFACRSISAVFLLLLFTRLNPAGLPTSGVDPRSPPERVLKTWEGSDCTVSVTASLHGSRTIKINSSYILGSTDAYAHQVNQARVPLYLFPDTRSIFFLGLGTGITAGASLDPHFKQVERIVSCELVPEVIAAAKQYMPEELTGGVFTDPRSTLRVEDGRHYLMASGDTYDMINADLFLPYRRGAGSLYSLDHYWRAGKRLAPGGVYVQWLPLYQITENEFGIIVRTMLEAFAQVTMWRNNLEPGAEIVALIGQHEPVPIPPVPPKTQGGMLHSARGLDWHALQPDLSIPVNSETITFFYCGNVTAARNLFDHYPVNTDNRPLIEYLAPRTFRRVAHERIIWFVGPKMAAMTDSILARCPAETDPMLRNRSAANRRLVTAGAAFHRARISKALGEWDKSRAEWSTFVNEWSLAAEAQ